MFKKLSRCSYQRTVQVTRSPPMSGPGVRASGHPQIPLTHTRTATAVAQFETEETKRKPTPSPQTDRHDASRQSTLSHHSATPTPRFCCPLLSSRYKRTAPISRERPAPSDSGVHSSFAEIARSSPAVPRARFRERGGGGVAALIVSDGGRVEEGGGEERADRAGAPQAAAQPQMRQLQRARKCSFSALFDVARSF